MSVGGNIYSSSVRKSADPFHVRLFACYTGYTRLTLAHLPFPFEDTSLEPVSYTHLDVYKRQVLR